MSEYKKEEARNTRQAASPSPARELAGEKGRCHGRPCLRAIITESRLARATTPRGRWGGVLRPRRRRRCTGFARLRPLAVGAYPNRTSRCHRTPYKKYISSLYFIYMYCVTPPK